MKAIEGGLIINFLLRQSKTGSHEPKNEPISCQYSFIDRDRRNRSLHLCKLSGVGK